MKTAAIIAEYNPFHNGHAYHIQKTKEILGVSAVVAIMSGNFVQRGDSAICDKYLRAQAAVYGGCDLVIELPVSFSVASANRFAFGGISLLSSLNIIDYISFGSEFDDINSLFNLSQNIQSKEFSAEIKSQLENGVSYPVARSRAANVLLGENYANILSTPNNILAIEYLLWLKKLCPKVIPFTIKRHIADYHDLSCDQSIASASGIRALLKETHNADISSLVPKNCANIYENAKSFGGFPIFIDYYNELVFSHLLRLKKEDIKNLPDVSEGLENRIFKAFKTSTTLEELYNNIKTKRYTHARIRRIIISAFLGINKQSIDVAPQYIRVLAFNKTGSKIIKSAKASSNLPIITKTAHINKLSDQAKTQFESECLATFLYSLGIKNTEYRKKLDDFKRMPIFVK